MLLCTGIPDTNVELKGSVCLQCKERLAHNNLNYSLKMHYFIPTSLSPLYVCTHILYMHFYINNGHKIEKGLFYCVHHLCDICIQTSIQKMMDYSED